MCLLFLGSSDRRICVWDASSGKLICSLPPQQGSRVKEYVFDGACSRAAMLLYDGSVLAMDLMTGACIQQVRVVIRHH